MKKSILRAMTLLALSASLGVVGCGTSSDTTTTSQNNNNNQNNNQNNNNNNNNNPTSTPTPTDQVVVIDDGSIGLHHTLFDRVNTDGSLTLIGDTNLPLGTAAQFPGTNDFYFLNFNVLNELSLTLYSYHFNPTTGAITNNTAPFEFPAPVSGGTAFSQIFLNPTATRLYYLTEFELDMFNVNSDFSVTQDTSATKIFSTNLEEPILFENIQLLKDGKSVALTNDTSGDNPAVEVFPIDSATGHVGNPTVLPAPTPAAGGTHGRYNYTFLSPNGNFFYAISASFVNGALPDLEVEVYSVGSDGSLTYLPSLRTIINNTADNTPIAAAMSPSGQLLIEQLSADTFQAQDSFYVFNTSPTTGALTAASGSPFKLDQVPAGVHYLNGIAISQEGYVFGSPEAGAIDTLKLSTSGNLSYVTTTFFANQSEFLNVVGPIFKTF